MILWGGVSIWLPLGVKGFKTKGFSKTEIYAYSVL